MERTLGNNPIKARDKNIALIIKIINRKGTCSRSDLAKETGLTKAGITHISRELIDRGLICEIGSLDPENNHRSIGLAIDRRKYRIVSAQINRHFVRAGLCTLDGLCSREETFDFSDDFSPDMTMKKLCSMIDRLLAGLGNEVVVGIGVALPGPFLPAMQRIVLMSGTSGWTDVDIHGILASRYLLPVVLEHDANCGALAELWFGDAETQRNILFVNVTDGIGAGIICEGRLYRGQIGTAGEIGHMSIHFAGPRCECGNRGCLELYCSLRKLRRDYEELLFESGETEEQLLSANQILERAREGDRIAYQALSRSASYLGIGLVNLVNIIGPGTIILADRFDLAGDALLEIIRASLREHLPKEIADSVTVRLASEPRENLTLRGAAVACLERLLAEDPRNFSRENT